LLKSASSSILGICLVSPVKYEKLLFGDGKLVQDIIFTVVAFWVLKLMMIFKIVRLVGG
jgi:hypothetical protein